MLPKYTPDIIARFEKYIDRSDSCHIWTGAKNRGYGVFTIKHQCYRANRMAWELAYGPIPDGLMVLHNCPGGDNPSCVNPAHLWLGDDAANMADRDAKGRQARGERNGKYTRPESTPRGERHGRTTLTDQQVREIRALAGTMPQTEIARHYGVSKTVANHIILGQTWRHVV